MKDIIPAKKQSPILGLTGLGGGVGSNLSGGSAAEKLYGDDIFSTYVYSGNNGAQTGLGPGVDMTKGGLAWVKRRSAGESHYFFDSERINGGVYQSIYSNSISAQDPRAWNIAFNNNGLAFNDNDGGINASGSTYVNWQFRKAKGFFDVVTYTGSGSTQTLTHNLGSIPGMIMVKRTDTSADWGVYHRGQNGGIDPEDYRLRLNSTTSENNDTYWGDTAPTATHFTVGDAHTEVNASGGTYVAYLFAGGASTAATAKSLRFNGSSQSLHMAASTNSLDFASSGQITIEFFVRLDSLTNGSTSANYQTMVGRWQGSTGYSWLIDTNKGDGDINLYLGDGTTNYYASIHAPNGTISADQWYHIAIVKNGTTGTIFVDGIPKVSSSSWTQGSTNNSTIVQVANNNSSHNSALDGQISNFRVTNGQALYTAAFKPPTEPLTTTSQGATASNVKILMCQDTNPTVGAVTTGTITNNGSTTASTDSPFDDPEGFKFGADEDQNIIKCGSYEGNGSSTGPEINLGWEPQWVLVKNVNAGENWKMFDSMRGIVSEDNDAQLTPNLTSVESTPINFLDLTPTGFKVKTTDGAINGNGNTIIYMCLRRPDGYVGKPAEVGTDVFAMDTQIANGYPMYISNFAVDYALHRDPTFAGSWEGDWYSVSRLQGLDTLITNGTGSEQSGAWQHWDYNNGFGQNGSSSYTNWQAWMWKRHAGCDVVTYVGDGVVGRQIAHSLNKTPEMMWIKNRSSSNGWIVFHKGLGGGTNPSHKYLQLNSVSAEADTTLPFNDTEPTSTHFTVGGWGLVNGTNESQIAMLFASVDGISKVGYYDGQAADLTITTGFSPRFLIVRRINGADNWWVFDTFRGWVAGNNSKLLQLDSNASQSTQNFGEPLADGFTLLGDTTRINSAGNKYIYYAHA